MWWVLRVLFCIVAVIPSCIAVQRTFTVHVGSNSWDEGSNWYPAGVPGVADDVIIPYIEGEYEVVIKGQALCASMSLGGPSTGVAAVGAPWPANQAQTLTIQTGSLTLGVNSTIYASGIMQVQGSLLQGQSSTGSLIQLDVLGAILFDNSGAHSVTSLQIVIDTTGYMTVLQEPNGVILTGGASIVVAEGGNLTLASAYGIANTDGTAVYLANYGNIFCVPGGTDDYQTSVSAPFQNFGTVYIQSGQVSFSQNSTWHGSLNVTGTVNITTGTHLFYSDSSIQGTGVLQVQNDAAVTLQGNAPISFFILATGSASVTVLSNEETSFSNFQMSGGSLTGTAVSVASFTWGGGNIQLAKLDVGQLQIVNYFTASISNTPLIVEEIASFANTTHLLLHNSTITLMPEASMVLDKEIFFICSKNDTTSALQIAGSMKITYPQITTLTCELNILPSGVVTSTAGILDIQTLLTCNGILNVSAGSSIVLETESVFFVGSSLVGSGVLNCLSCSASVYGTLDIGTLNFPAGNITVQVDEGAEEYNSFVHFFNQSGSSSLTLINNSPANLNFIVGNLVYYGGSISSNQNQNLNLQTNVVITNSSSFYGVLPYQFTNFALVNNGSMTFYGACTILFWEHSIIYNSPSATITVSGALDASQNDHLGYLSEIFNYGVFKVNLGAFANLVLNFHNLGNGVLIIDGQVSLSTGFFTQRDDASSVIPTGGVFTLSNTALFLGGYLNGTGVIEGAVTVDGATIIINADSSPTIASNFLLRGSGMLLVDVSSNGMLKLGALCQIYGGSLILISNGTAPNSKQFASARSVVGSGVSAITYTYLNSTFGFSYTNNSGALYAVVAPNPVVSAITPNTGSAGITITITGSNFIFDETYWNISVVFQGQYIPATVLTRDTLLATVPLGTGKADVLVVADGRFSATALSWSFRPPFITSVSPSGGDTSGVPVTITGENFGDQESEVSVEFGAYGKCTITQISNSQIACITPPGIGANVSVTVQASQQTSLPTLYNYGAPILQSVYPSALIADEGTSGSTITITGQNLASSTSAPTNITVKIGNSECTGVTLKSLSTLTCALPAFPSNGAYPIVVQVANQESANLTFRVLSIKPPKKASNSFWPPPMWVIGALVGGAALFLAIGIVVGWLSARRCGGGRRGDGYNPAPTVN